MAGDWRSAAEWAALDLPGVPSTKQGFGKAAANWQPTRPRQGRGGGLEYHITALPDGARTELTRRATAEAAHGHAVGRLRGTTELTAPAIAAPLAAPTRGDLAREDAKAAIMVAFDAFRQRRPALSPNRVRHLFVGHWNAGDIAAPDFARQQEPTISEPSLRRWLAARAKGDLAALRGKYGNRAGTGVWDTTLTTVRDFILGVLARLPDLSAPALMEMIENEFGRTVEVVDADGVVSTQDLPSVRAVQKLVKRWRDDNPSLVKRLTDPDGWKNSDMLALGDASAGIERPNQVWMIDASPQDAIATDGRHQIYALIDVHTRRLMVLVTKTPRTEAVKLLLRAALLSWGVPETLITDNGSDFVSKEARRVFAALRIAHDPSTPFSPWEKAFVERVIGTLQHGLFRLMPGYCGHDVATAQKIRARRTFAARMGETERETFEVGLSAQEIQVLVTEWVDLKYHHRSHGGLGGRTPFQMVAEWAGPANRITDARALDMLLCRAIGERRITKKGLRIANRYYWDPEGRLLPFAGSAEPLEVRMDPADPHTVYVYRPDPLQFICAARCLDLMEPAERAGVAVRARKAQRNALAEQARATKAGARPLGRADVLKAVLENARERTGTLVALPKVGPEHSTPGLQAAAEAARAQETRAAPAGSRPLTSAQQAAQDRVVVRLQRPAGAAAVSDEDRWWTRAMDIRSRVAAGEAVTPAEAQWLAQVEGRPWFRAREKFAAFANRAAG